MNLSEMARCIKACANYLREREESPRAANDLEKALVLIELVREARTLVEDGRAAVYDAGGPVARFDAWLAQVQGEKTNGKT